MRRRRRWLRLSGRTSGGGPPGRRILLVAPASSYRISPYLNAARNLGLHPWVVSQGKHSLVDAVSGGIQIDLTDPDTSLQRVLAACRDDTPLAVVATDDATVALAAHISARLGLPHNPPEAAMITRRKDFARGRLAACGVPVPGFWQLDLERPLAPQLAAVRYPCVVKPVALSGSRGVIRANDPDQLQAACARTAAIVARESSLEADARRRLLVEQFIPGPEVALEGLLHNGRLQVLALFDKPDPLDGPFFEETYYVSPSRLGARLQQCVYQRVEQACQAYGLRHGPVHAELRLHDGDAWPLDIAARTIGGQCARILRYAAGRSLEELVLAQAAGLPLPSLDTNAAAGVLMIPIPEHGILRRVEGVLEASKVPGVDEVEISVREGYELVPLPEGASYLGFVFASGDSAEQVESALRAAHRCLHIVTVPVLPVAAEMPS